MFNKFNNHFLESESSMTEFKDIANQEMRFTCTSYDLELSSFTNEDFHIPIINGKNIKINYDMMSQNNIKIRNGTYQDKIVAIKQSEVDKNSETSGAIVKEMKIMAQLKHENIITFYGCIMDNNKNPSIVMELMDKNLFDILTKVKLNLFERIELAKEACKGMSYLAQQKIFHGDYKTENVLYDVRTKKVKIADFGFSEKMIRKDNKMEILRGTPYYLAPEVFAEKRFGSYSDVYSFGISLSVHVKRTIPYEGNLETSHFLNMVNGPVYLRPELPFSEQDCPSSLKELIFKCWHPNSSLRPTFSDILREIDYVLIDCIFSNFSARCFWKSFFVLQNCGLLYNVPEKLFVDALVKFHMPIHKIEEAKRVFLVDGFCNILHFEKYVDLYF